MLLGTFRFFILKKAELLIKPQPLSFHKLPDAFFSGGERTFENNPSIGINSKTQGFTVLADQPVRVIVIAVNKFALLHF